MTLPHRSLQDVINQTPSRRCKSDLLKTSQIGRLQGYFQYMRYAYTFIVTISIVPFLMFLQKVQKFIFNEKLTVKGISRLNSYYFT